MSRIYTTLLLVASFLENFATCGYYYAPGGSYHGPSAVFVVFFCCAIFCLCRRLIDVLFKPGGSTYE